MPLWEHCKLVRRTLSKRFYPNVIRNLECPAKTDFVVLPTISLFVVRFFFSRILFLRTYTTAHYIFNLEMGKRGIEPPMFTAWERIYSPPQHRQSLPLPQSWHSRDRTCDILINSQAFYLWTICHQWQEVDLNHRSQGYGPCEITTSLPCNDRYEIRTRVTTVKGWCLHHSTNRPNRHLPVSTNIYHAVRCTIWSLFLRLFAIPAIPLTI